MNAVAVLYSWFQNNLELIVPNVVELEFKDSGRGSAVVRLETDFYLMELCAWNHSICLDVQIIEIKSEASSFLHAGECESMDEFNSYLSESLAWFKREVVDNA